jgi:hypothetical protein
MPKILLQKRRKKQKRMQELSLKKIVLIRSSPRPIATEKLTIVISI